MVTMRRIFSLSTVAIVISLFMVLQVSAMSASANTYTDAIASALTKHPVYIEPSISGFDAMALNDAISSSGENVAVAVIPDYLLGVFSPNDIANAIKNETSYSTVFVAVTGGYPQIGVATSYDLVAVATLTNGTLASTRGDLQQSLITSVKGLNELSAPAPVTGPSSESVPTEESSSKFPVIGFILIVIASIAVMTTISAVLTSDSFKRINPANPEASATNAGTTRGRVTRSKAIPTSLAGVMDTLDKMADGGTGLPPLVSGKVRMLIISVNSLFARVVKKGNASQLRIAEVEYGDKLPKLIDALNADYYVDIMKNPSLWDNPDERLRKVESALDAVNQQIIDNIKQVNASRDLEFAVVLESLIGSEKPIHVNDMLTKKEK